MPHHMTFGEDPYAEGYDAAQAGLSSLDCPYAAASHPQERAHWLSGYAEWERRTFMDTNRETRT